MRTRIPALRRLRMGLTGHAASASGGGGSEGLKANFLRKLTAARPGRNRVIVLLLDLFVR